MAASTSSHRGPSERNIVRDIVKSIMILDRSKKPFKYSEIVSNLNPKPTRKKWAQILEEAKVYMKNLGLILHEIKSAPHKMYFVTSETQPLEIMYKYAPEEEVSDRILLTFVLTFIFMKNGLVFSDKLLNHLQLLGIYNESKILHPYFGNVKKKVLTDFPEQLYLELVKVAVDPDLFEVRWGKRAEIEISKRAILEFICKQGFGGKVKPQEHTSHYEQVLIQERGGNANDDDEVSVVEDNDVPDDDSDGQEVGP